MPHIHLTFNVPADFVVMQAGTLVLTHDNKLGILRELAVNPNDEVFVTTGNGLTAPYLAENLTPLPFEVGKNGAAPCTFSELLDPSGVFNLALGMLHQLDNRMRAVVNQLPPDLRGLPAHLPENPRVILQGGE